MKPTVIGAILTVSFGAWLGAAPDRIRIDSGTLAGDSTNGVRTFKGVPFAQPPVGTLRWAAPQPITWTGERDATKFNLPCPQPIPATGANGGGVSGATSEDCLYLNVYAPADAKNAPVMMWLYGGAGYLGGAHLAAYDGTASARQGVITVTVNYRLGALGNFAHPALTKAAKPDEGLVNYALMDAIAGLQWIKHNIGAFGGDPMVMHVVVKELSRSSPGFAMGFGVSVGLAAGAVVSRGTHDQIERWGLPLATLRSIGSWCLTEPGAGSDAFGSMRTIATHDGDGYKLNGSKTFITNGPGAEGFVVYARLDDGIETDILVQGREGVTVGQAG